MTGDTTVERDHFWSFWKGYRWNWSVEINNHGVSNGGWTRTRRAAWRAAELEAMWWLGIERGMEIERGATAIILSMARWNGGVDD